MKRVFVNSAIFIVLSILYCSSNIAIAKDISKIEVKDCSIDFDEVNFCTKDKLKNYNNVLINKTSNFDNNKYLINFKEKEYYYFAVVDLSDKKVYTFPASLGAVTNVEPLIFSRQSNSFCLNGNFNQFQNSYRAVQSCYSYNDGKFYFKSRRELNKVENTHISSSLSDQLEKINLPISSDSFSKCAEKSSVEKCEKNEKANNRAYSLSKLKKISPELASILSDEKISLLNADVFRFLPKGKNYNSFYTIAEKNVDTDEEAKSEFYLIKLKPEISIENIGDYYSIDASGIISYKGKNGKTVRKNLK